jgi:hypothetical protein
MGKGYALRRRLEIEKVDVVSNGVGDGDGDSCTSSSAE